MPTFIAIPVHPIWKNGAPADQTAPEGSTRAGEQFSLRQIRAVHRIPGIQTPQCCRGSFLWPFEQGKKPILVGSLRHGFDTSRGRTGKITKNREGGTGIRLLPAGRENRRIVDLDAAAGCGIIAGLLGRSSNGRTRGSGPRYRGSIPCLPADRLRPAICDGDATAR